MLSNILTALLSTESVIESRKNTVSVFFIFTYLSYPLRILSKLENGLSLSDEVSITTSLSSRFYKSPIFSLSINK